MKSDSICRGVACQVLIKSSFLPSAVLAEQLSESFSESETRVSLWLSFDLSLILPCGHGGGRQNAFCCSSKRVEKLHPSLGYYPIPKKLCRFNEQQSFPVLAETSALKLNGGFLFRLWLRSQNVSNRIVIDSSLSP